MTATPGPAAARPVATETAVLVPMPAADSVVARHRLRFDPAAAWGVPAHITVLFPFVAPGEVDEEVLHRLGAAVRSVAAFDCVYARTEWFGDEVLWLAPEPDVPFRRLTEAVGQAFPEHPPYEGEHPDPTPHLTVAHAGLAAAAELGSVESDVRAGLPIEQRVTAAWLMAGTDQPGSWHVLHAFPLGPATG